MQLLIYLVILVTTTECTSIQNCGTGPLTAYKDADDFSLTCMDYTAPVNWEFKTPGTSYTTIVVCDTTSCTFNNPVLSAFFNLTVKSASSSELLLTPAFTGTVQVNIFKCDGVECTVSVEEPTTVPPATTVITESTTEKPTSDDGLGAGAIAGIAVACCCGLGFCMGCLIWRKCKKSRRPGNETGDKPPEDNATDGRPGNETDKPPADNATDGRPGNETGDKPPADNATDGHP